MLKIASTLPLKTRIPFAAWALTPRGKTGYPRGNAQPVSAASLLGGDPTSRIQFSEEFTGSGAAFFKACADNRLEGIVSKLTIAPYRSGRTKTWLKTKCFTESAFVVIGTDRDRKTGAVRALLAPADSDGLSYAGAAFIALRGDERSAFFDQLEQLKTSWAVFKSSRLLDVQWCKPALVVKVKHLAGSKTLRQATVKGFSQP